MEKVAQKCSTGNTRLLSKNPKPEKYRNFTVTDYELDENFYMENEDAFKYVLMGLEKCPSTGRMHWQGYVIFKFQKSIKSAQKYLKPRHVEIMRKGTFTNYKYCKKDGNVALEIGMPPLQGQRTDLIKLKDDILEGRSTVNEITETDPYMFHMYGRTMMKLEDLRYDKNIRSEMTKGIWYYGPTAVGKSHKAFEGFYDDPSKFYVWPRDKDWWDNYKQQEIVIINDFRGQIPYDRLLELLDKWPTWVSRRNRPPINFTSKKIIITSSLSPEECYHNRHAQDNIEQLLRRLEVHKLEHRGPLNDWLS